LPTSCARLQRFNVGIDASTSVKDVVLLLADRLGLGAAAVLFTLCAPPPNIDPDAQLIDVAKGAVPLAWGDSLASLLMAQPQADSRFFLKRRVFAGPHSDAGLGDQPDLQRLTAAQIVEDACQGLYPEVPDAGAALQQFVAAGMADSILGAAAAWPTGKCASPPCGTAHAVPQQPSLRRKQLRARTARGAAREPGTLTPSPACLPACLCRCSAAVQGGAEAVVAAPAALHHHHPGAQRAGRAHRRRRNQTVSSSTRHGLMSLACLGPHWRRPHP
jgi:hypothetical protein